MHGSRHTPPQSGDAGISAAVDAVSRQVDAPDIHEIRKLTPVQINNEQEKLALAELAVVICELSAIEREIEDSRCELEDVKRRLIDSRRRLDEERLLFRTYANDNLFLKNALPEE